LFTDFLEEHAASIFRVEEKAERGKIATDTVKRRAL
jgi:hypothetical protein